MSLPPCCQLCLPQLLRKHLHTKMDSRSRLCALPFSYLTVCLCVCQCAQAVNALVVGTTHRFKGKYITSVLYKPRGNHSSSGSGAAAGSSARRTSMQQQQPFAGQQPQHH